MKGLFFDQYRTVELLCS